MMIILYMITGALLVMIGYFLCYFMQCRDKVDTQTEIKRIKPNLRNPLHPYVVAYDKYKGNDGLYAPQNPVRKGDF